MKPKLPALYLIALITVTIAGSCKKDGPSIIDNLSGTYESSKTQTVSDVRMYTSQGEVKNRDLINKFVAKNSPSFTLSKTEPVAENLATELNIAPDGKATIVSINDRNSSVNYIVAEKSSKGFVLTQEKSAQVFKPYDYESIDKIFSNANQAIQYSNCKDGGVFRAQVCDFTPKLPFVISQNKLYLPMYSLSAFYVRFYNGEFASSRSETTSGNKGIFNESAINLLSQGDTLVVQTRLWEFVRKN